MATRTWLDYNGDFTNVNNWSGAAAPVDGDTVQFLNGSQIITTNMNQSALDNLIIQVGHNFRGEPGSSSAKLQLGTGNTIHFNGTNCPACWLDLDGGNVYVHSTSTFPNALQLTGTITNLYVASASNLTLSALTVTNVYFINSDITCTIEGGCTITNVYHNGGNITNLSAITNIYGQAGIFSHEGTSTYNITLLESRGSGFLFQLKSPGATITTMKAFAGKIDGTMDSGSKTITNSEIHRGAIVNLNNGCNNIVTTNAMACYGAEPIGGSNVTKTIYLPASGAEI